MYKISEPAPLRDWIKIRIVLACWRAANLLLRAARALMFRKLRDPRKILVFRTGSIGDNICAMPAAGNLRAHYPEATIVLLTNAGKGLPNLVSFEALAGPGMFDRIINYENLSRRELAALLRKEQFDLVVHFTQYYAPLLRSLRDMFYLRFFANIRQGFGWRYDGVLLYRQTQERYLRGAHEKDRLNAVLRQNGVPVRETDEYRFRIERLDRDRVDELLRTLPLGGRPCLAVVPGAKRPQNRWPVEHFEAVVRHFCGDFNIFLIGGPDDAPLAGPLAQLPNTYDFCGRLTPVQSGLLMQRCALVLSNDTGPMHLAYAFGVPVVALFSNRDFSGRWFPPDNEKNTVLRAEGVDCAICFSDTCDNNVCMKKIRPETVIDNMDKTLSATTVCAE